jgi:chaperonin GroEL
MPTRLIRRDEARSEVLAGAAALADAVRATLGPKSKCVLIERRWGSPLVCNDGVTIAKELDLEDPQKNLGVRMLREAASRTGDLVGDGTTTSTLLAYTIVTEGMRNVVAGASAIEIKRGLERGLQVVGDVIKDQSRPVKTRKEKAQIAAISAHNDAQIGELVAEAMEKVGAEGVVSVEESKTTETSLEVVEGMQFDRGYLSPYFVTDPQRLEARLEDCLVLLVDRKIGNIHEMLPLLERVAKSGRPLLVVAEEVENEALATLVVNKLRGTLPCCAVKAPGFGDRRKAILQDIAVLTGAEIVSEDLGNKLSELRVDQLGACKKVVAGKDDTTLIGGGGDKRQIQGRCEEIRRQLEKATSDYDKEKLQERLAKLAGGVAVIRVGAPSEAEMKNKKEAFEDAICSTKAAVAEGLLPGGGLVLVRAIDAVHKVAQEASGDERTGLLILARALETPTRQIAENSGYDGGVVIDKTRATRGNVGFDAQAGQYVDLLQAGIVDPTKVVRVALENAVSVAGTLLLIEGAITTVEKPVDQKAGHELEAAE